MPTIESYQLLLTAAAACEDKKAEDIRILELDPNESGLSDYFLICNGTNERQNVAITDEVELRLKREYGVYPNSVEGRRQADWILMDYVDFIVHVFSPEKRAFYGLERLRKSAKAVNVDDLNTELTAAIKAARAKSSKAKANGDAGTASPAAAKKSAVKARKPSAEAVAKPAKKAARSSTKRATAGAAKKTKSAGAAGRTSAKAKRDGAGA